MTEVEDYIYNFEGTQRKIMLFLHDFFVNEFNLNGKLRYKIPFYFRKSWVCYLNPLKNDGVELAFVRANELSNRKGILDFKDRKMVAGMDIYDVSDIPVKQLNEIMNEALLLDELIPYSIKKKKE